MNKLNSAKYFVMLSLSIILLMGCKEAGPQPEPEQFSFNYPITNGVHISYSVDSIDAGGTYYPAGQRESHISGQTMLYGTPYFYQYDTLYTTDNTTSSISYIRKSANGVYYYIDTSGINQLIPDSLRPFVFTDPEMVFYSFPFQSGRNWMVYKFVVGNISVINISAEYKGRETLAMKINNRDTTLSAYRIDYQLAINIPDSSFSFLNSRFRSTSWLADGYGVVKTKGSKAFTSLFTGAVFDISDTSGVIEQKMTSFH